MNMIDLTAAESVGLWHALHALEPWPEEQRHEERTKLIRLREHRMFRMEPDQQAATEAALREDLRLREAARSGAVH